ncbi:alpha/beta hydrolase-fold protein [Flavobacterium sp. GT3R68]|uniref:alpha/beta hydrolase-fold protein n=1 Tax=Flavobacterium sp. GT3R68 TaxID=2594437 RepID=UPI000F89A7BC|nr:alpha/beta hydrolase-fold protein [Flavobacterium sp. GT3R68]RTY88005.1 alpha/beta hydrolase [Flavobacterium sp. GSN2]TRW91164.1 alpha/beta hydrolase [Flavobacterium sp. GT3R68]
MRYIFYVLLFVHVFSFGQTSNQIDNKITIGTINTIHSDILNEEREVLIYVPNSSTRNSNDKTRYPVLYLLDGYSFFHSVTGMVQYLSAISKMPEMIVVAIVNTDRVRDLTPTHSTSWSNGEQDAAHFKNSGGGEKFLSFVEKELIPYIDSHYKTEPYRMFVGHSLGGLTVVNALIKNPELFNSYVAIDPSIWWDNKSLMKQAAVVLKQKEYLGKKLFFASANTMNKEMDTMRVVKDTANSNLHVRDNLEFRELLKKNKNKLDWKWKYYADDNHLSIPLIAEYDALRYFFKEYELPKDLDDSSINAGYIQNHYRNISEMLGYTVLPPQSTINFLGYNNLSGKRYDKAYGFFKMNIDNYPASANAFDSMGDYYMDKNDRKKAIESFEKALSLKEVSETRKKLEKLQIGLVR